jgi:DNA-binding transcriptional ArsR family regulator
MGPSTEPRKTPPRKSPKTADEKLLHALRHPLRIELLRHFSEGVCSPNELSERLNEPLGTVSYHVRELEKAGAIELVDERQVRGAVEHLYRSLLRPPLEIEEWSVLADSEREMISCQTLQNVFGEAYAALSSGSLDSRMDRHLTWSWLSLDEEGWRELMALLRETTQGVEEIESRNVARAAGDGSAPQTAAIVGLMGFERARFASGANGATPAA